MCPAGGMTEMQRGMPVQGDTLEHTVTDGRIILTLWYNPTDIPVMQNDT